MKIRKFIAADMREAVAQVKRELGPEAMIVATKHVRRGLLGSGVEVTAAIDVDDQDPAGQATNSSVPPPPSLSIGPSSPTRPGASASPSLTEGDIERVLEPLRSELRSLKIMLRQSEARPDAEIRSELTAIRHAIANMSAKRSDEEPELADLATAARLAAAPQRRRIVLVGPTGVGKTTTIAKLAARSALIERRSVALVTLDGYRIGGEEQIRTFADLMGVPLTVVADPDDLRDVINDLSDFDRIYVDTAGRSPRDGEAISALETALARIEEIEIHLAVAAAAQPSVIDSWVRRYSMVGIDRLLFTKVDEADYLGELVRAPARLGRPVSFITTGQRVPEDLEDATPELLLRLATAGMAAEEVAA